MSILVIIRYTGTCLKPIIWRILACLKLVKITLDISNTLYYIIPMKLQKSIKIEDSLFKRIKEAGEKEDRVFNNMICVLAKEALDKRIKIKQ